MTNAQKAGAVRDYARHTTGSEQLHRHWTNTLLFTDGILYLADTCGAHWLIDAVASWQPDVVRRTNCDFQVWRLEGPREDGTWLLTAWSDTPGKSAQLARQEIGYSNFPPELAPFEWWVENRTMMLKEER